MCKLIFVVCTRTWAGSKTYRPLISWKSTSICGVMHDNVQAPKALKVHPQLQAGKESKMHSAGINSDGPHGQLDCCVMVRIASTASAVACSLLCIAPRCMALSYFAFCSRKIFFVCVELLPDAGSQSRGEKRSLCLVSTSHIVF